MKKLHRNLLLNVELEVTPLTQDAEGKLLGGFVGMQGMRALAEEKNSPCSNSSCSNQGCVNIECNNNSCKNAPCAMHQHTYSKAVCKRYYNRNCNGSWFCTKPWLLLKFN